MKKYNFNGNIFTEEELEEYFSMKSFVIFNERAYTNWKKERINDGRIKVVEE